MPCPQVSSTRATSTGGRVQARQTHRRKKASTLGGGDGSSELIQKQVLLSGENQSVPGGMHAIAGRKLSVPRTVATGLLIIIAAITTTITVINGRRIIITISTHSISLIIAKPCQSSGAYS